MSKSKKRNSSAGVVAITFYVITSLLVITALSITVSVCNKNGDSQESFCGVSANTYEPINDSICMCNGIGHNGWQGNPALPIENGRWYNPIDHVAYYENSPVIVQKWTGVA